MGVVLTHMSAALTYNEKMVRTVRAAILEAVESGALSATISRGGASQGYTRYSLSELRALEAEYLGRVARERANQGGRSKPDFGGF